jgi:ATP-dependent exoDNAse (exonuclease V) alpha subunit
VFKTTNKRFTLDQREQDKLLNDVVDKVCTLKVGANVMIYRNYDIAAKLTNGRLVIVLEINEERNVVRIKLSDGMIHDIRPKEYEINGPCWRLSRTQIPLRPAWAITNYKCQGMTLDYAIIKLSECFANGQVYTTLARVVSLENAFLIDVNFYKIKALGGLPF